MDHTPHHPVDIHVGQKLRQRRLLVGMTQEQLASAVGVSFQMIQKYEKGARIGVSRLTQIARALGVAESFFFPAPTANTQQARQVAEDKATITDEMLTQKETINLLKAYYALPEHTRKHVLDMMKGLQEGQNEG